MLKCSVSWLPLLYCGPVWATIITTTLTKSSCTWLKLESDNSSVLGDVKSHKLFLWGMWSIVATFFSGSKVSLAVKHQNDNLKPHDAWKVWYWTWDEMNRFNNASDTKFVLVPTFRSTFTSILCKYIKTTSYPSDDSLFLNRHLIVEIYCDT